MARGSTVVPARTVTRCAIYTRKSTEEGLEQEFNSLQAQREACAAYILSQRHEGWTPVRDSYDDGGFSGGNMDRPGLKRLMAEIEAGRVDVIVVYKVDRLTRALSDFARIVDVLDKRGASFVSVTQAFNTTTSMGRLTLNVLLSFAQFEREVTGERIRDKVAASKRKGMWMGGPVPLGYRVFNRKLVIDDAEAKTVRHIMERYVALGTGRALIEELRADGYRTRLHTHGGKPRGGIPFERGVLFAMLANQTYIGKVVHNGEVFEGEHEAIVSLELWDAVQQRIATNRVERKAATNVQHPSLLAGIIRDGHGRRMTPSHANKAGRRYRYYITHPAEVRDGGPPAWRMPAHDVENAVVQRLRRLLTDRTAMRDAVGDPERLRDALDVASEMAQRLDTPYGRRSITNRIVEQVRVEQNSIEIDVSRTLLLRLLGIDAPAKGETITLRAFAARVRAGKETKLLINGNDPACDQDRGLVRLLAEARLAQTTLLAYPGKPISALALELGQCRSRFSQLIRLAWLAPEIVSTIVDGRQPRALTPRRLLAADLPADWAAQKMLLGIA